MLLAACNLTIPSSTPTASEPGPLTRTSPAPLSAITEAPRPTPTPPVLGTVENPLILALAPSAYIDGRRVEGGKSFADQLTEETGYAFVVVVPESYARLVEALGQGNAHVAFLSPYAYAYAYEQGFATAAFAGLESGEKLYGAQFIARRDAGYASYFDPVTGANTADAATALAQFNEKKPCWSDEVSASGRVIPAGVLASNGIRTRPAAILQGQPTVVRAVYVGGICDFGATYIDARTFPTVREAFPDVLEEVSVIWQIPPVIPYANLSLATSLPQEMALNLNEAIFRISGTQAGRGILVQAYGMEYWEPVSDPFYDSFRTYLAASGIDVLSLMAEEP
jgi:phosphonate transport system substrate-binding protein